MSRDDDEDDDRPRPPRKRRPRDDEEDDDDYAPAPTDRRSRVKDFSSKKIAAGVCGILLGGLGIHKFILGFTTPGILMLVVSLVCFSTGIFCLIPLMGFFAMHVIGLVEGIIYLTKSDEEFYRTYAIKKQEWF